MMTTEMCRIAEYYTPETNVTPYVDYKLSPAFLWALSLVFWGGGRGQALPQELTCFLVCLESVLTVNWDLTLGCHQKTCMWPLCTAWATPHSMETDPQEIGRSHVDFANLVSEVTQCHSYYILFEEQSQRSFSFKGGTKTPPLNGSHDKVFAEMF